MYSFDNFSAGIIKIDIVAVRYANINESNYARCIDSRSILIA